MNIRAIKEICRLLATMAIIFLIGLVMGSRIKMNSINDTVLVHEGNTLPKYLNSGVIYYDVKYDDEKQRPIVIVKYVAKNEEDEWYDWNTDEIIKTNPMIWIEDPFAAK